MNKHDFYEVIVSPTLDAMGLPGGLAAKRLVLGTALHESGGLQFIRQRTGGRSLYGPGLSFYQFEMATVEWLANEYLARRADLGDAAEKAFMQLSDQDLKWEDLDPTALKVKLESDMRFATALCRLRYWPIREPLPQATDLQGLARYWLKHYNAGGKGTVNKFVRDARFIMGVY